MAILTEEDVRVLERIQKWAVLLDAEGISADEKTQILLGLLQIFALAHKLIRNPSLSGRAVALFGRLASDAFRVAEELAAKISGN